MKLLMMIRRQTTDRLMWLCLATGAVIMILLALLGSAALPDLLGFLGFASIFFFWGLAGLVVAIRKELPIFHFFLIRGQPAVLLGLIWLAACWYITFAPLWRLAFGT